ncbi:hypothetical protein [Nonomuraea sp. NPDC003709]|uniref:hypothetical protein n=1 Tax=Nonomuraea sp. NPDC003709 TaxID=3154450 RepID=UPI0033B75FD2
MTPTVRSVLLSDLDTEPTHAMTELEELLLTYSIWQQEGDIAPGELPAPLAGDSALQALRRRCSPFVGALAWG